VLSIWSDVLSVEDIGRDDTFVALGGDSVAATVCATQLWREFGVDIEEQMLVAETMTIGSVSAFIDCALAGPEDDPP